ncbi:hypothetical protein [Cupriavidus pauculus]|uniref:hypothetical protein n=1 Tax=Cupriavidus pauculus TaxID=82633 RepID=UPI00078658E4|nr:hypothetical protein [Cupriavidus pauculus]
MKQENKFVAQLFHYLAPFIDMAKPLLICVDGGAARAHAGKEGAPITDQDIPDLWMSLVNDGDPFGIEAKVIDRNSISIRQRQVRAWRTDGTGHYRPAYWVATNRELSKFWCWKHTSMAARLDGTSSTTDNVILSVSKFPADYQTDSLSALALYILSDRSRRTS